MSRPRRWHARGSAVPVPNTPEQQAVLEEARAASGSRYLDDVEFACDDLIRQIPGSHIVALSVSMRAQLPDLPDRRYYCRGLAFWAELKRPPKRGGDDRHIGDKLTDGQYRFLEREYQAGSIVFAGDRDMLQGLILQAPSNWRAVGWIRVQEIAARGFRKER